MSSESTGEIELAQTVARAQDGDDEAFGRLVVRHRPELEVHCYRLLGSLEDAEDVLQDVLVQVWRALPGFEGRSSFRTWLYRIATRTCMARHARDRRRRDLLAATTVVDGVVVPVAATVPWLQVIPDRLLDEVVAREPEPGGQLTSRETIEIAFIAALQHLTARQRAVLVLRDVVGWTAEQCAAELDTTLAAVNGALRRGRRTLRSVLGADRDTWPSATTPAPEERDLLRRYIAAIEAGDDAAIAALLRPDAIVSHQPRAGTDATTTIWYQGRSFVIDAWAPALHNPIPLDLRLVEVWVNRQPAVASYARLPGTDEHRAFGLAVLRVDGDHVAEVINLTTDQFANLGLPTTLPDARSTSDLVERTSTEHAPITAAMPIPNCPNDRGK